MKREDIELRNQARRGVPSACLAMAEKLFSGRAGLARNYKLGMAYLQQEIDRSSPPALQLAAASLPLDLLAGHGLMHALEHAAHAGVPRPMLKLGVWLTLCSRTRGEGVRWLRRSTLCEPDVDEATLATPDAMAAWLAGLGEHGVEVCAVALCKARQALREHDAAQACYCIRVASHAAEPGRAFDAIVLEAVKLAASQNEHLDLPVGLVERSLLAMGEKGEIEAQYGLGCALGGIAYGHLQPHALARGQDVNRAAALLLRAADGGKRRAWLDLFRLMPHGRKAFFNPDIARFFLEKAASCGIVDAQTQLGALLLEEAASLDAAEVALHWLTCAADKEDPLAHALLQTLVLPLPALPPDYEKSVLEKAATLDREIGARLALARALHLTRYEAMSFSARRDIRPWGLVIPGNSKENPKGRLAPAVSPAMKLELARAAAFFSTPSPFDSALFLQRSRAQRRIFELLSVSQALFFSEEIGRTRAHYGYGRHWASKKDSGKTTGPQICAQTAA